MIMTSPKMFAHPEMYFLLAFRIPCILRYVSNYIQIQTRCFEHFTLKSLPESYNILEGGGIELPLSLRFLCILKDFMFSNSFPGNLEI